MEGRGGSTNDAVQEEKKTKGKEKRVISSTTSVKTLIAYYDYNYKYNYVTCASCALGHPLGCLMSHACQPFSKLLIDQIALFSARRKVESFESSRQNYPSYAPHTLACVARQK